MMALRRFLCGGLVAAAILLPHFAAGSDEEVCSAAGGGSGVSSCRPGARRMPLDNAASSQTVHAKADLISQEVEELTQIITLSQERIKLLEDLQGALNSGKNLPFSESHAKALREKVPLLSQLAAEADLAPVATAEDYLVSKTIIPSTEELKFLKFMPLRNLRSSSSSSSSSSSATSFPSALLVTVREDGGVRLFSPSGELVHSFSTGHEQPVTQVAVSPSQDEYFLATCDSAGVIRTHQVSVRSRRLSKNEKQTRRNSLDEKVSQHLGSMVNVTAQLHREMQVPVDEDGELREVTSLALSSQGGSKFVLAGDVSGKINVLTRNGTVRARIDTSAMPGVGVDSLFSSPSSVLFRSGAEWGYVDLEKLEVKHVECPAFHGRATYAVLDAQVSSRVLVADEVGTVWAFGVKSKRECKVDLRFASGTTKGPIELASVRGFAIGLEGLGVPGQPVSLVALNLSQTAKRQGSAASDAVPPPPANAVVWRRTRPSVRAWAVQRRTKEGDLLAFLSEDGREVEIMELLMHVYTAPPTDSFGNFKMPMIAVAIVLVLGYQYMKHKGKSSSSRSSGLGSGSGGKLDLAGEDFASLMRKKKLAGLRGAGGKP